MISNLVREDVLEVEIHEAPDCPGCIRLDRNENPYGPSPKVIEVLRRWSKHVNRYPDFSEIDELREAIARYSDVHSEEVLVSCGSDGAIDVITRAVLRRGDCVLLVRPSFTMYEVVARWYGGVLTYSQLMSGSFSVVIEDLLEKASKCRLAFIANPNNPTGNVLLDRETTKELLSNENLLLVVDEAYYEYSNYTLVDLINDYPNLVVLRTFSKAFGLAGLRVGYILAADELVRALMKVKLPYDVSKLSIKAAKAALEDLDYLRRVVETTKQELRRVSRELERLGFRVYPSVTNFVLLETRSIDMTSTEFSQALFRRGIAVRDLAGLFPDGPWYVRVSMGTPEENSKFLSVVESLVRGHDT